MSALAPIALVAISLAAYQLAQRSISHESNPWAPLLVAYGVGVVFTGVALVLTTRSPVEELRQLSVASLVLGFAVVGIEFGYLQAHRVGWNPAAVGLAGSVAGTIVLAVVVALVLREPLGAREWIGLSVCLLGLIILHSRVS